MNDATEPQFVTIPVADVAAGKSAALKIDDTLTLAVCEHEGRYFALDNKCPHRGAPLADGEVASGLMICPLHHFKFNLETGRCLMPKHLRARTFTVTREGDLLKIEVPQAG